MLFKVIEVKTFSFDSHSSKIPIFTIKKRYKGSNFNKNVTRYLYVVVNCFAYYVNSSICYMLCVNHLKGSVELKDAVQNLSSDQSMLQILLSSKNRPEGHPQNKDPSSMKHASTVGSATPPTHPLQNLGNLWLRPPIQIHLYLGLFLKNAFGVILEMAGFQRGRIWNNAENYSNTVYLRYCKKMVTGQPCSRWLLGREVSCGSIV